MEIGAQLFTVREHCQSLETFSETLKKIADIGYRNVQISGTCAYEPIWLKEQLEQNGLRCVLTHTPDGRLINDPVGTARDHDLLECKYVGLGWYNFGGEDLQGIFDKFVDTYRPVAQALKEAGKYFMYHNHGSEFRHLNGEPVLQQICRTIPAENMGITLDTYWVQVGGGDPAQWLEKLAHRVPCIHLKDCAYEQKMAVLGEGNINFDRIFEKAEAAGTQYMLVEQDKCYEEDPFDCLRRSFEYLKACGMA